MDIRLEGRHGVSIFRIQGDMTTGEELLAAVRPLLAEKQQKIVLDLTNVGLIMSAGLGDLVRIAAQCNSQSGHIVLASPSPFVQSVLETTHLNRFFNIADSVEASLVLLDELSAS